MRAVRLKRVLEIDRVSETFVLHKLLDSHSRGDYVSSKRLQSPLEGLISSGS